MISFTVFGQPVSMKNSRQLIPGKGNRRPMIIKSQKAREYEKSFLAQIMDFKGPLIETHVQVKVIAYYASRRPDLDCELICDCLQRGGILKNDRQIVIKHFTKKLDPENPRAEITIAELEDWDER